MSDQDIRAENKELEQEQKGRNFTIVLAVIILAFVLVYLIPLFLQKLEALINYVIRGV